MSKKKLTSLVITGSVLVGLLVIIASYAYWQLTKKQPSRNDLISACLNFEMKDAVDGVSGLTMQDEWPISDEEGINLEGYHFTVENKCSEAVNYIISLEALKEAKENYLDNQYIKLAIDNEPVMIYGSLEQLDNLPLENDTEVIRDTREIMTATVRANAKNEHEIKMWISSDAPLEQQGKTFKSRIRITGGQGVESPIQVTADTCFEFDEPTGEITKYLIEKEECGKSAVIPASINNIEVKRIDSNAFKTDTLTPVYYDTSIGQKNTSITSVDSVDVSAANIMFVFDNYEENTGMDLSVESVIANATYVAKLTSDDPVNAAVDQANQAYGVTVHDLNTLPELTKNQIAVYANLDATFDGPILGAKYMKAKSLVSIDSLDLSLASNLERIEDRAFSNVTYDDAESLDKYIIEEFKETPISLTELNFGNNTNNISIGSLAFSRIDVDYLELYTSYVGGQDDPAKLYHYSFTSAEIDNLTIKPTADNKKIQLFDYVFNTGTPTTLSDSIFRFAKVKNLFVAEGIEEIDSNAFLGAGSIIYTGESLMLPNSLKNIGANAFYNYPFNVVNLGTGITNIGHDAFGGMSASQIINVPMSQTSFDAQTTKGSWAGDATIEYNNQ